MSNKDNRLIKQFSKFIFFPAFFIGSGIVLLALYYLFQLTDYLVGQFLSYYPLDIENIIPGVGNSFLITAVLISISIFVSRERLLNSLMNYWSIARGNIN